MSQPATRPIGASRSQKHSSWIVAESSAPKPEKRVASCAIRQRPVFLTDVQIVSVSCREHYPRDESPDEFVALVDRFLAGYKGGG